MAVFETWLKSDLKKPVTVKQLEGVVFSQDSKANKVGVIVTDNGEPVTLSGTVYGYVIKPNGTTVEVAGVIDSEDSSRAYFVMPQEAYAVGHISIVIKLSSTGSVITTLAACTAYVYQSRKGSGVVPTGTVIPDLQALETAISESTSAATAANTAATAANTAAANVAGAIAPPFAEATANDAETYVTKDGKMYFLPNGHTANATWANTTKTEVTAGGEICDLKSALQFTAQSINLLTNATVHSGYKINPDGELEAVSTYTTYEIACDGSFDKFSAEVYSNSNYQMKAVSFINSGGTVISTLEFPSTSGNSTFTDQALPSGTAKFYLANKHGGLATPSASASVEKSQRLDDIEDAIDDIHQIPSGGTQGQVLAKSSGTDYAVQWVDQSEGGEIDDTAGIGDTDKTWSANKIELQIDPINDELNFQSTTKDLLSSATLYTGYKLDDDGNKASASNFDVYEIAYDGTYNKFSATIYSNSNYQMKAISFQNAQGTVLSTLAFPSTSAASTFTDQAIPSGTSKILLNNKRADFTNVVCTCPAKYSKRLSDIENADDLNTKARNALVLSTKNLFDISKATNNCIIVTSNGNTAVSDSHMASDYISVSAKTIYTISAKLANKYTFATTGLRYVFYDSSKAYISGFGDAPPTTFRTPANAAYIRFSMYNTLIEVQLERRHFATKYAPYNSYVVDDESDSMFLSYPAKMYAVTGLQYNFYMFNVTPEQYAGQFMWDFGRNNSKMHNYGRFMRIESNNSSTSDIKCSADVRSQTKCARKEFVTKVKNPANLQNVSVLILGDSTTANGYVAADLHTYSGNESKITTLGTKGTAPNNHEGRSGWTLNLYFTEDEDNPFYNPTTQTFDAEYYFTNTGVSVPDIFIINLGINDMHYDSGNLYDAKATADSYIEKVNAVITSLRLVSATMKIAICLTIPPNVDPYGFGAAGTNIMNYDQYRIANLVLCEKLIDEYDYRESEYLYLIPINSVLDTKYNMPSETSTPNSRSNTQITVPNTAGNVHPNEGGYYQIADEIYAFICSLYVS